jgi:hypothetical protein
MKSHRSTAVARGEHDQVVRQSALAATACRHGANGYIVASKRAALSADTPDASST